MKLTKNQVKHIAKLARIELTEAEIKRFQKQLSSILEYVDQLNEIDTSSIEPTAQVTGLKNVMCKDEVIKEQRLTPQQALSDAPEKKNGYFKVEAVLE